MNNAQRFVNAMRVADCDTETGEIVDHYNKYVIGYVETDSSALIAFNDRSGVLLGIRDAQREAITFDLDENNHPPAGFVDELLKNYPDLIKAIQAQNAERERQESEAES